MSDFFERLVARDRQGGEPLARPRLPQIFERAVTEQAESVAPTPPAPWVPTPEVRDVPPVVHHTVETVVRHEGPPPVRLESPVPVATPLAAPQPPPVAPRVVAAPSAPAEVTVVRETEKATPPVLRDRAVPLPPAPVAVPRPAPLPQSRRVEEPRPVPAPVPRRIPPRAPDRVVRVSIGRIEVTAATAGRHETPRRRQTRNAPVVTLERYLSGEDGHR
jgi:hypothetical protein